MSSLYLVISGRTPLGCTLLTLIWNRHTDCYPVKHLEGSYISVSDLNNWNTVGEKKLYYFGNGSTTYEESTHDNQWHVRWILRERGITLVGPKPETILKSIPVEEMRNEIEMTMLQVMKVFQEEIDRPLSFWNSRFGQSFAVLTYCRMLHTLHTGTVHSKKAGAKWAKAFVDPRWIQLIDRAWHEREGVRFGIKIGQRAQASLLYETREFIRSAHRLRRRTDSKRRCQHWNEYKIVNQGEAER